MGKKKLCVITWTVEDVKNTFNCIHGRLPNKEELESCLEKLDVKTLEEVCIERGWSVIQEACE